MLQRGKKEKKNSSIVEGKKVELVLVQVCIHTYIYTWKRKIEVGNKENDCLDAWGNSNNEVFNENLWENKKN